MYIELVKKVNAIQTADTSKLVQKIDETEKKNEKNDHSKYINTPKFNKLTSENLQED